MPVKITQFSNIDNQACRAQLRHLRPLLNPPYPPFSKGGGILQRGRGIPARRGERIGFALGAKLCYSAQKKRAETNSELIAIPPLQ